MAGGRKVRERSRRRSTRLTRRVEGRRLPFVPYGLVPLVGLVALLVFGAAPFAYGVIQDATQTSATEALRKAGIGWAQAQTSGQWVELTGAAPSREEADRAVEVVRVTTVNTFFGEAAPATWVSARFTGAGEQAGSGSSSGVRADPAPADAAAASCDRSLAVLLEQSTIQFAVGSAAVRPASDGVLDRIAREALACPGVLRIEGYTDNVGDEASNLELSRKRAEAVLGALLRRGVPGERLMAEGFGADKPVANNNDGMGRARNRRIEIRVVRPDAPSPT